MSMDPKNLPVGPSAPPGEAARPCGTPLIGTRTLVTPLQAAHTPTLYKHLGGNSNAWLWTHLPTGEFRTYEAFEAAIEAWSKSHDPAFYAVLSSPGSLGDTSSEDLEAVGILAYVAITPKFRRIEIGYVILGEPLRRSRQATEAFYLTLRHAFDDLGYARVEWKANRLNAPSLRAAERLGFSFDGIFRYAMTPYRAEQIRMYAGWRVWDGITLIRSI